MLKGRKLQIVETNLRASSHTPQPSLLRKPLTKMILCQKVGRPLWIRNQAEPTSTTLWTREQLGRGPRHNTLRISTTNVRIVTQQWVRRADALSHIPMQGWTRQDESVVDSFFKTIKSIIALLSQLPTLRGCRYCGQRNRRLAKIGVDKEVAPIPIGPSLK
jgi:hypothetical protein